MVHKSIKILGSSGFVGSNLLWHIEDSLGIPKESYERNIGSNCDVLINANGNSKKLLPECYPLLDFDLTVRNTLRSVTEYKYETYVYISSCEVYGNLEIDYTVEDAAINVSKISRYALSKYLAECIVKQYCKKWIILRLSTPIGMNMKKGPVYDVMQGDPLWISKKSELQLIDMRSVADFIKHLIKEDITNEVINLTGRDRISVGEIADIFNSKSYGPENPTIVHKIDTIKANRIMRLPTSFESINNFRRDL